MINLRRRLLHIFALVCLLSLLHVTPASGDSLPDSAYVTGVSGRAQGYLLSCESRSAVDLAAFWGVSIGEAEFLQTLPRDDNPDQGFVGHPNDAWGNIPPLSYGVHADPVAKALREYGLQAEAHHELSWDNLRAEIDDNRPVIVWVIGQMWDGKPVEYEAPDGSTATVAAFEHTMILTGYSPDTVQVVDAYTGMVQSYPVKTFLKSWSILGNMAVFVSPETTIAAADETNPESYTVQKGDFLVALADRFGTTWQELARLNSIGYPFVIFPGQVLQVPGGEAQAAGDQAGSSSIPAESPPAINLDNVKASLPLVQRSFIDPNTSPVSKTKMKPDFADTITVWHSTSLLDFSRSIGMDWHLLAELNNLHPPYLLHLGQVLKLK